ncbi:MAG TPA: VWA domain-containing protein [Pirellulales bacterium]|nr:VWA domain-containing protein [Pirellulales bacterium]
MPDRRCTARAFWLLAIAIGLILSAARGGASLAAEAKSPSGRSMATILRQLKSSKPRARAAAVAKVDELPAATAVKLLVERGLASPFADLRHASYGALLARVGDQEVCDMLLDRVKKALGKQAADEVTCGTLGLLLASDLKPVRLATGELLDGAVRQPGGRAMLVTLAGELGLEADSTSLASLWKLSKLAVFEQVFAVRRAVVRALALSERPEAIDALVEILGRVDGEVQADIARHLTTISGEPHALDAGQWRSWWQANRSARANRSTRANLSTQASRSSEPSQANHSMSDSTGRALLPRPATVYAPLYAAAPTKYYGLPIYAQRLMFVIDTSGSMSGARLDAAKRELLFAIAGLPEGVRFNVLVFNGGVAAWSDTLQVASRENKALAAAFVLPQFAIGNTCTHDALLAAMAFDVEAIYFLTDGQPCGGSLSDPTAIVAAITMLNQDRLVSINTLGIGVGLPGSVFDIFLFSLAAANQGQYRRVDQ